MVVLFLALALFARGGPAEAISAPGLPPELSGLGALSLGELGSVSSRLFSELGFATVTRSERADRYDLIMEDSTPVTGQRIYLRCVLPSADSHSVQSAEVQAALDTARGEHLSKAVVVTSGVFSDEARGVSRSQPVDLIDGAALAQLLRSHLPDVAHRLGLPR